MGITPMRTLTSVTLFIAALTPIATHTQGQSPPRVPLRTGLTIVTAVADAWGVEPRPSGKIVWAEFNRDRREGPDDAGVATEDS